MILDKYQIQGQKKERGYSFTAIVIDNFDKQYLPSGLKELTKIHNRANYLWINYAV